MHFSYKNLFKISFKIYAIGEYSLSRPITLDGAILFIILLPVAYIIAKIFFVFIDLPILILTLVFNFFLTGIVGKYDPQGRSVLSFLWDLAKYILMPKKINYAGKMVPAQRKKRLYWDAWDYEG